jgi:hypothetical protein
MSYDLKFCCEEFELLVLYDKADYISLDTKFWALVWEKHVDDSTGMADGFVVEIEYCPFCGRVLQSPYPSAVPLQA